MTDHCRPSPFCPYRLPAVDHRATDPFVPNRNELLVDLRPYSTWSPGRTKPAQVDELSRRLTSSIPGAAFNFTQPIIDTATEIVTGSSADLAVIISGPDLKDFGLSRRGRRASSETSEAPPIPPSSRKLPRRSCYLKPLPRRRSHSRGDARHLHDPAVAGASDSEPHRRR
jgi:hypothetical protein